jgi:hypothetical protein
MIQLMRLQPFLLVTAALGVALAAPATAELVLLQGGDVVKVTQYEIGPERARLVLPSGGVMTISTLRIDRVLADEIVAEPEPPPVLETPTPTFLALGEGQAGELPIVPYGQEILAAGERWRVNPHVIAAVMRVESAFRAGVSSKKGARGLMQLMPATAARFGVGVDELHLPERNLEAGTRYLRFLIDRFGEDPARVFAAYNAGEHAVERFGGIPPYRETQDYVRKVMAVLTPSTSAPSQPVQSTVAAAGTR